MQIPSAGDGRASSSIHHVHASHVQHTATTRPTGRNPQHKVDGVEVVGEQAEQIQLLVTRLQAVPASRENVVGTVRGRLDQGEYATRDAAERTAARILGRDAIS